MEYSSLRDKNEEIRITEEMETASDFVLFDEVFREKFCDLWKNVCTQVLILRMLRTITDCRYTFSFAVQNDLMDFLNTTCDNDTFDVQNALTILESTCQRPPYDSRTSIRCTRDAMQCSRTNPHYSANALRKIGCEHVVEPNRLSNVAIFSTAPRRWLRPVAVHFLTS